METVLEFVAGTTDLVKVKNRYTVPYKTGLLMIIYQLLRPHRVRSDMEVKFGIVGVSFLAFATRLSMHYTPLHTNI
jgi:hypothetical protein